MGSVFKKTVTKPLPAGADIVEKGGRRYARWKCKGKTRTAPLTEGRDGSPRISIVTEHYYARYRDHNGRDVERIKSGILTPVEEEMTRHQLAPLADHFDAFDDHLRAKDASMIYRTYTRRYLDRLAAECPFARLADLKREAL